MLYLILEVGCIFMLFGKFCVLLVIVFFEGFVIFFLNIFWDIGWVLLSLFKVFIIFVWFFIDLDCLFVLVFFFLSGLLDRFFGGIFLFLDLGIFKRIYDFWFFWMLIVFLVG